VRDFAAALAALDEAGLRRRRRTVDGPQGPVLDVDGRPLIAFASNDYLGLANHPAIAEAVIDAVQRFGVGAGASHLISGHHAEHARLEDDLARFVGAERALTFSTGYMANTGIVPALAGRGDAVFSDALNHACLIDGARLSRTDLHVYPHADMAALDAALRASPARHRLILSDAVFSMDGDLAPILELADLAERHDALLLLDDAHGFGVLGPHGEGTLAHCGVRSDRILHMGTLGKAAGVAGAFVAGRADIVDWLVQRARTYVFTTATPPMLAAAVRASLVVIREEGWRRERLRAHARRLRDGLASLPWRLLPAEGAIQPLIIGDNTAALQVMDALIARGYWAPAIRPPTVPEGTARLRISLSAAHSDAQVDGLVDALVQTAAEGAPTARAA
jgi:8-amino-7-oxononanoate synthase